MVFDVSTVFNCFANLTLPMKILDAHRTAEVLPYAELVSAIATAARQKISGQILAPERQVVQVDASRVLLNMPAIAHDIGINKFLSVYANNGRIGLPSIQGEVTVFDSATGRRLALLDGPTLTGRRTAAVSMLGILTLARKKPTCVMLIGTGFQASVHADALIEFFGVRHFLIAALDAVDAEAFCYALRLRHAASGEIKAEPILAQAIGQSAPMPDVIIALTTSKIPVIPVGIGRDTLAIGVGAFKPEMAEFPSELLHARAIVVDCLDGARHEAGDLIQAAIDWSSVRELAQVLDQSAQPDKPVPVFKTVGQAAWDLAAARVAVEILNGAVK